MLEAEYEEFMEDLGLAAESSGEPQSAAFFQLFAEMAAENGDCVDLTYCPIRRDGSRGYQLDGYALESERGELHLAICDFSPDTKLRTINAADIDRCFNRLKRFCGKAVDPDFVRALEETSYDFEVANQILRYREYFQRIRVVLFTNAQLSTRRKVVQSEWLIDAETTFNVVDFRRYVDILRAQGGVEEIEIDLREVYGGSLPCVPAHIEGSDYESYLMVMPGTLLCDLYALYGPRLMEQNVRTYLQARTKVNKGILDTIQNAPERFFAYNNGVTATATGVTVDDEDGIPCISALHNLQIVNGGQTTASLLHARDRHDSDLAKVFVQLKLSVVDAGAVEEIVPKISRFANTQNRISEADFFSNHPFHIEMEKLSRRMTTPAAEGALTASRWYYERARGQYRNETSRMTAAKRREFEHRFPRSQVIQKTDLSKYYLTFECRPHIVSLGAQKCFLAFAKEIGNRWEKSQHEFNEAFFRESVAKAIIFNWLNKRVARSDWYRADRGYKANIITYTIAWLVNAIECEWGRLIDYEVVWKRQDVPAAMQGILDLAAPLVATCVKTPMHGITNVTEYAKKEYCWLQVQKVKAPLPAELKRLTVSKQRAASEAKDARKQSVQDASLEVEIIAAKLTRQQIDRIEGIAAERNLLSPKSRQALSKIRSGRYNFTKPEANAFAHLLNCLQELDVQLFEKN